MSSTSTVRQSGTECRDPLRTDTNPLSHKTTLPFERPDGVVNKVPEILHEYRKARRPKYENMLKELEKKNIKPPTLNDEHKRIIMALIEPFPLHWSRKSGEPLSYVDKRLAFDVHIRTGIPIRAKQAKNYYNQLKEALRVKLCESIQNKESPSETEITLNQWPKYNTIRFFRRNMYKSEVRMRAEVAGQAIDLGNCRDFPDYVEDDITTSYLAPVVTSTNRANSSTLGTNSFTNSTTIGVNSSNRHVDVDDETMQENGPVDRHVRTPARMDDIVVVQNQHDRQNARAPSVFEGEYELPPYYDQQPYQPRVRQQFSTPSHRFTPYSTQRAPKHHQAEQLQQGQREGYNQSNTNSPKTMSSMSTVHQSGTEYRDLLRPDTKPLIHKVTPPFERPDGRVNEVPPILDEYKNITMVDYEKKLKELEKSKAKPAAVNHNVRLTIMALIERIPEMWSGKSSRDQTLHYKRVAFDTYIRTGLPITGDQANKHFKSMKETLRQRLRKSINNLESPSETEMRLSLWPLYYTIRFFRRNHYMSEARMRAEVANQVIDLENCRDFPDYVEDDITTGDFAPDTSITGTNTFTNRANSSSIGANSSTVGARSSSIYIDDADETIQENGPVDRNVRTPARMDDIVVVQNHHDHQNARAPSVFEEEFDMPQNYEQPPYQGVRQQVSTPAHRFTPYPMQRAPSQQLQQGMPRRSGGYNQSNTNSPVPVVPNSPSQNQHALAISGMSADLTRVANKLTDEKYGVMMKVMHDIVYAAEFEEFDNPATLLRTLMSSYERH